MALKQWLRIAKQALLQEKANANNQSAFMNDLEREFLPAVLEVTETPPSGA